MGSVQICAFGEGKESFSISSHENRMSFAFCCPNCGELWAKIYRGRGWYFVPRWCSECPKQLSEVNGSLFQRFDWFEEKVLEDFLRVNPDLLHHEFQVHLNWVERPKTQGVIS